MDTFFWVDEETGLFWEIKQFSNKRYEYTIKEAHEYVLELNQAHFGGFCDWRLPSLHELSSLASLPLFPYGGDWHAWRSWFEQIKGKNENGFFIKRPLCDNVGKDGWYWSGEQKNEHEYYLVNFKEANTNSHVPTQSFYVRCVRG